MKTRSLIIHLCLSIVLTACSMISRENEPQEFDKTRKIDQPGVMPFSLENFLKTVPRKITIATGHAESVGIEIPGVAGLNLGKLECGGKIAPFYIKGEGLFTYLSMGYKSPKSYKCKIDIEGIEVEIFDVINTDHKFKVERLNVAKKHIDLAPKDVERWKKEVEIQKRVYGESAPTPYFTKPFKRPMKSYITSEYGVKRVFNNKKDSWHSGTDFRGAIGTPIPNANRGRVVFTGDFFFNGKTVIVDHGMGIHSMYCHMSEITTTEGEIVPTGAIIGKVGATGRVSGPHLHWGVKILGNWVNGLALTKEPVFEITTQSKNINE